jgi:hypothetical protein
LSKITGTIPRQKHKIVRGENDYRKQLIALSNADAAARLMGGSPYASVREYLANNLFDTVAEIPDAHSASLSYQVGQMKSKRSLTLTDVNNAGGIVDVSFEANVPDSNVVSDAWYNVGSDGTITYVEDIDPIEVLKKKIREIKWDNYNGYPNVCVEIDEKTFFTLIQHPKVLTKFGYMLHPELRISAKNDDNAKAVGYDAFLATNDAQVKELFRNAIGADVVLYNNTVVGADKLNASTKKFETAKLKAFAEGVVLIRPTGVIGTIRNVVPLRPDGSAISGSIFGGRGIIEYRYNNETRTQTWVSELTVLAVPNQPKKMYYFEIAGTAEVASE